MEENTTKKFYQKWWFYLIIFILITGVFTADYKTENQEVIEEVVEEVQEEQSEREKNKYYVVDAFIKQYNSVNENSIIEIKEIDIQDKEHYRTEFRLSAYKGALAKEGMIGNSKIELINFEIENTYVKEPKALRLYIQTKTEDEMKKIVEERMRKRIESQPLDMPNAGSVFRNPETVPAGKLIDDAGLKGTRVNDAQVSEIHANFIINKANATSEDIIKLIDIVKTKVKDVYDIDLYLEQEIIE